MNHIKSNWSMDFPVYVLFQDGPYLVEWSPPPLGRVSAWPRLPCCPARSWGRRHAHHHTQQQQPATPQFYNEDQKESTLHPASFMRSGQGPRAGTSGGRGLASVWVCPKGGGAHSPVGEGLGESQFRRLEKKLNTLPTLWDRGFWLCDVASLVMYCINAPHMIVTISLYRTDLTFSMYGCLSILTRVRDEAELLDVIGTKVFLLVIHSHLY